MRISESGLMGMGHEESVFGLAISCRSGVCGKKNRTISSIHTYGAWVGGSMRAFSK